MSDTKFDYSTLQQGLYTWPLSEIRKILVIGHGALAERQKPTYEHWLDQGVDIHCADVEDSQLNDCLDGIKKYVLPKHEAKLISQATSKKPFDLLCVNNIPELHLATALQYGTYAKRIIIQKPQDLNFPLIRTIARANGQEKFRSKTVIHDHYRNKSAFVAMLNVLPSLIQQYGKLKKIMFFLTEAKGVREEHERAGSLKCGMIQDLAVHQISLMLECLVNSTEWQWEGDSNRTRRIGGTLEIKNCVKMVDMTSILSNDVETFAAIDLHLTEKLQYLNGTQILSEFPNEFDALIVVGKGLVLEQGIEKDCKGIVLEFARTGAQCVVDLTTNGLGNITTAEPINRNHGGMNRPLMLISPNPPTHAIDGAGDLKYRLWQSIPFAQRVASLTHSAQQWPNHSNTLQAYPYHRPLGDLIRELVAQKQLRMVWNSLPPFTSFRVDMVRPSPYYD